MVAIVLGAPLMDFRLLERVHLAGFRPEDTVTRLGLPLEPGYKRAAELGGTTPDNPQSL